MKKFIAESLIFVALSALLVLFAYVMNFFGFLEHVETIFVAIGAVSLGHYATKFVDWLFKEEKEK